MSLLTLAVSVPTLRPPSCGHGIKEARCDKRHLLYRRTFYGALYIIALEAASGGTQPNISTTGLINLMVFNLKKTKSYHSLIGTPFYRHKLPTESPFTRMAQVIVSAVRKWKALVQAIFLNLNSSGSPADSLAKLPWRMAQVRAATSIPNTILAPVHTLFIKQGTVLDRSTGPHFEIPPACLTAFVTISMLLSLAIYDRYFVPMARHYTKRPRGITLLQRLGIGFVIHVIFILMGVADNFEEVAKIEFFYDQSPEGMKSLGTSYFTSSLGIGNFLSRFTLSTVSKITKSMATKVGFWTISIYLI
ncbi:PROTEIN NRT1/ PTR FAMILY 5.2-LIKE [Salix koriyanagi]|uniref:PROTEIN NRT1/ PTR FAMILY 5.2-LIKE n=1 Tax=Salix koriyanagi TaxID=2511006 RepID=A0A9Q0TGA8_9ROSI|nr:PROTEIN NRT1/ PTR FAMILY 5.2-LIKE [Salix koriyanagi]